MRQRHAIVLGSVLVSTLVAAMAGALPSYEIVPLGLTDFEHTASDGYRSSGASDLTATGYVIGYSQRYNGGYGSPLSPYGASAWLFDSASGITTRLGYYDVAHTDDGGVRFSSAGWVTESGYAFGTSTRFRPGDYDGVSSGTSVWVYDAHNATQTRLGYFDAGYTSASGFQRSRLVDVNEAGYALGTSDRFAGANSGGTAAWLYSATTGTTTRLGYFDAAHTQGSTQFSSASMLTESGYAIGISSRYDVGSQEAWLYRVGTGTTTRVGLSDVVHTRSDGYQFSTPTFVTESGDAIGNSSRFGGSFNGGQSAWYYDSAAGSTSRVGLVDAAHTRSDGYQSSSAKFATESGYAAGTSVRYVGPAEGSSAWLYEAGTAVTTRLGYFDAAHTKDDGYQVSQVQGLTDSGYAIGSSLRFDGATTGSSGGAQSAWIYDAQAATTTRLGYSDGAHTRDDGYQFSSVSSVTESGYAIGYSTRSGGTTELGRSAWLFDANAGATTRLGYFDAAHTRNDGYQFSWALRLTDSGYASGRSSRFNGATPLGQTSWIYRASDQSQQSVLLSQRSDGYADSFISYLGEDGLALGRYTMFAANDTSLGDRAFVWTPDTGAVDLGALVLGGLSEAGWSALASAIRANGLAEIIGSGDLQSGGTLAYLLVAVPEPGTGLIVSAGLLGLAARRRRA
jgi:hypothetical protein